MTQTIFQKGENIQWDFETESGLFQCICADEDTAIFAPVVHEEDSKSVKYRDMFAVSNFPEMNDIIVKSYKKIEN